MNTFCQTLRFTVPGLALVFYWYVGVGSTTAVPVMDHYRYHAAYAVWILLPYALWIVLGYRFEARSPFLTSALLLLLVALVVHIRVLMSSPHANMFSILILPFLQFMVMTIVYFTYYMIRQLRHRP